LNNPYTAPAADLSHLAFEEAGYAPSFLELDGRIGRVRYIAYTLAPSFVLNFVAGIVLAILMPTLGKSAWLGVLLYIPVMVLLFVMGVRRLNDLNATGWISLLGLVPFVNLIFWLVLLCMPGSVGSNRYGPAPRKNTPGVIAAACTGPVVLVFVIGVLAAVAIPAYQDYVRRAKSAQQHGAPAPAAQQDAVRDE
jgi:uncharacterized membrane protein YhaH (DUF805 family)